MSLLARIQRHLRETGTSPTRFGREVLNDPRIVPDLVRGREMRPRTVARIEAWLDAQGARR